MVFHEQEFVFHIYYAGVSGYGNAASVLKTYVEELRQPESGPEGSWLNHITIHSNAVEDKAILIKAQFGYRKCAARVIEELEDFFNGRWQTSSEFLQSCIVLIGSAKGRGAIKVGVKGVAHLSFFGSEMP